MSSKSLELRKIFLVKEVIGVRPIVELLKEFK
jgi:hypothetical protein